ncbi:MAG: hypothetical protein ABL916_09670 [Burkholderiaceae bacterium]
MRPRRVAREPEVDPFYDMLFNMLIAFVFCFIVALLAMNPTKSKAGDVPAKAEYILTLSWPDLDPNDIDTWVRNPAGEVVWFRNREAGLMYLDRDDRGESNSSIVVNGRRVVSPFRQEVVTIRGVVPGEYVVNAHYYESKEVDTSNPRAGQPVDVTLSVVKVNPRAEVVFNGQHRLAKRGDEATLVRFSVGADGSVGALNTLPAKLVERL